ncbi:MAG: hypothetical protein MJA27_05260 [Pseudanabaenales cyanobacterium]|nr:hypothetical protein [Pseudanabaenales cyanobacterium]
MGALRRIGVYRLCCGRVQPPNTPSKIYYCHGFGVTWLFAAIAADQIFIALKPRPTGNLAFAHPAGRVS